METNNQLYFVGIDPGKSGAIVVLTHNKIHETHKMPCSYEMIDLIKKIINTYGIANTIFCIEVVGAMPGQGVSSMFTFGYGTGYIYGVLETLRAHIVEVSPIKWKKFYAIPGKKKASTLEIKSKSMNCILRTYPEYEEKYNSGIYDALLIARYTLEHYNKPVL